MDEKPVYKKIGRLPTGYTELEYIESTGTQYIDTGFYPNQDTSAEAKVIKTENTSGVIFGTRDAASVNAFECNLYGGTQVQYQYGNYAPSVSFTDGISLHTYLMDKTGVYIDGEKVVTNSYAQTFNCSYPLYVFANNNGGTMQSNTFAGKLYYAKVWDNGELIRDYIPCLNSDNEVGLYDLVNDVFYSNTGTGTFTTGTEIEAEWVKQTAYERVSGEWVQISDGGN